MRRTAAELREAGAHVVVFLSHLGIKWDLEYTSIGADLIVGGHTHTALAEPQWLSKTAVVQAGDYGRYVGVLDLEVDTEAGRLLSCRGRLIPVSPAEVLADEAALAIIPAGAEEAEAALAEVVAVLPEELPHDPVGASKLGPWIAEALRRHAGAEVRLAPGGQALHGFPAGPVTRAQLMDAMSPMFSPALLEYKGSHLLGLLEQSEDPACHGHLLWDSGMRPRGKPVGRIFAAGLDRAPDGSLRVNGEPVDPDRVYTVGAPSLLGFAESGYGALAGVKMVRRYMPTFVRKVFEEALRGGLIPGAKQ